MKKAGLLVLILFLPAGCSAKQTTQTAPETGGPQFDGPLAAKLEGLPLPEFFEVSWRELSLRDPENVLADGLASTYGLETAELTDISDAYIRETYRMIGTVLAMLRNYNRAELTPAEQISYDVYEWYLDDQVRSQEFMYYDYPATYFPVTSVHLELVQFFTDLHPLASEQDAQDYIARLQQVDAKFEQLIDGLERREKAGIIPPKFALQWGLHEVNNLASANPTHTPFYETFRDKVSALQDATKGEKQALLTSAATAIQESVLPAYQALADYLKHLESVAPTKDGVWQFEDGDAYYQYLLRHYTTTDLTADEIHELGLRELERIHAEMRVIFDQLGYPKDEGLPALFDRVARDSGTVPAGEVLPTYESLIADADRNLDEVFDIRPDAKVIVVSSSIKGMYVSASLDGSRPGAFHAGPGTTAEESYAMPTLAYHEAIPGHHFQIAIAQEADLPSFRNALGFTGYAEGWALYAEQLAWELGWYEDDPYGNLGRLQAEAYRATRLVVDTGLHAKRWTFDEAIEFFVENTGYQSGDSVEPAQEIARYIVWPGQATAYKVGMLKILELRQRAMNQLGDRFNIRDFHQIVLSNGSMPLDVLERVVQDYVDAQSAGSDPSPASISSSAWAIAAAIPSSEPPISACLATISRPSREAFSPWTAKTLISRFPVTSSNRSLR
jgi:uncharacterized protein (DUF885 family)